MRSGLITLACALSCVILPSCGTAVEGFVSKTNLCFPDYNSLDAIQLFDSESTPIDTADDKNTATAADRFQVSASIDIWGFQVYMSAASSSATAEIDLAQELNDNQSATNLAVTLPNAESGDILKTSSLVDGLISSDASMVDFKLEESVTLETGVAYWIMAVPTSSQFSMITGTVSEGSFAKLNLDSGSWTLDTTKKMAYTMIPCRSLDGDS